MTQQTIDQVYGIILARRAQAVELAADALNFSLPLTPEMAQRLEEYALIVEDMVVHLDIYDRITRTEEVAL